MMESSVSLYLTYPLEFIVICSIIGLPCSFEYLNLCLKQECLLKYLWHLAFLLQILWDIKILSSLVYLLNFGAVSTTVSSGCVVFVGAS